MPSSYTVRAIDRPLVDAVIRGDKEGAHNALMAGANVDVCDTLNSRRSMLQIAVEQNHLDLVEMLFRYKADPNVTDDEDESPLHRAIIRKFFDVADVLLQNGADVNIQGTEKMRLTPLHTAIISDSACLNFERIDYLLGHGADLTIKNEGNKTPVEYAQYMEMHFLFAKEIKNYLADIPKRRREETLKARRASFEKAVKKMDEGTKQAIPRKRLRLNSPPPRKK